MRRQEQQSGRAAERQSDRSARTFRYCTAALLLFCSTALLLSSTGCRRPHYRRQADAEVNCIIDHKAVAVGSAPGEFHIDIDPRSRMFDPNNPDCPPMPPDDPVSHQLMLCVDCKPGSPCWQHMGKTPFVENPVWRDFLPRDAEGNVVLDMTGAVQLALLESPVYQQQLETLYLSGLDVTFERFRFDAQFFGGSSIFYTAEGPQRAGRPAGSSRLEVHPSRPDNRYRLEKLTATGGELVVGFANSLIWEFAGPDQFIHRSVLDFSLIQPLLRAGGRMRVLERLTISERALLANVRQMEHYRRGFYLSVVTGRDPGAGPSRRGGFFGGTGLEGFAGVGVGGFGRVGGVGVGIPAVGFVGVGAQQAGGYIGLLQTAQIIRNQYANIAALGDSLEQLQAAHEAGRIDRFQVDLARQALYNAQSQLLTSQTIYQNALDNFKLQHGLPPDLEVRIADPMLDRFNLLDPELSALQIRVTDVLSVLREQLHVNDLEIVREEPLVVPKLPPPDIEMEAAEVDFASLVRQAAEVAEASRQRFDATQADIRELEQALPQRRITLQQLAQREEVQEANLDPDLFSVEQLDARFAAIQAEFDLLSQQVAPVWAQLDALTNDVRLAPDEHRRQLTSALNALSGALLELSLLQARARLDTITFEPVELTWEEAFCIASRYRRDWMNARAAVVDSWRLIHFNANALQSDLDLVFTGDIAHRSDRPPGLGGVDGRLRVGLQFDPPLTRLAERNVYRQSLIDYQQARRSYYQFRDRVQRDLRVTLRQLRLDELNFELRRAAVHVAITQVDLARLRLVEPARPVVPVPGQPFDPAALLGATLARDLVSALIDLLNAQNDFLSVWVDHEVQLLNLDFDLGTMELDGRGIRIEHRQPLRTFLAELPCTACEIPDACACVFDGTVGAPAAYEILPEPRQPLEPAEDLPLPVLLPPPVGPVE